MSLKTQFSFNQQKGELKITLPEYRKVNPDNTPEELKQLKIWVVWKPLIIEGQSKPGKLPLSYQLNELTGEMEVKAASCDDPNTWMTYEDALKLLKSSRKYKGLSIALSPEPLKPGEVGLIGIDLDNSVLLDDSIKPETLEVIKEFNTYFELSPGNGIRGLCYGYFPADEGVHKGSIEIYQYGKFLTITGHKLAIAPSIINNTQEAITAFRAKHFQPLSEIDDRNLPFTSVKFTDNELHLKLGKSKLGARFKELYYGGYLEGADKSTIDLELCRILVFWTQDLEQIDRIFRESALFRPEKWDIIHHSNGDTYGQGTIKLVLKTRKAVFLSEPDPVNNIETVDFDKFSLSMPPFTVNESGIFREVNKKDESFNIQISSTPCLIVAIGENIDTGEILYKLKIKDIRGREKFIWKTTGDLLKREKVIKLQENDFHFKESKANDLIDFFDKYITLYNSRLTSEFAASVGGWKQDFSMYILGNRAISINEIQEVLQIDNPTAKLYPFTGTVENWAKGAKTTLSYPAVRFKMYNACVPPLLRLLYLTSYVVDNNLESGHLKSVSNWLAASMWGDPIAQQAGGNSTPVGILKLIEYCQDIPTFLDETSQNPDVARKLVYAVSNTSSRLKGSADNKNSLVMPSATSTVLIATGEDAIVPENAHGGEDVRMVPLKEGVTEFLPTENITEMEILIKNNYGHIVVRYIQQLLKEKDNLRDIYKDYLVKLPKVNDITSNRAKKTYAAICVAGYLLEKVFSDIGITPMDPLQVCNRYFEMNVLDNAFIPDYLKALTMAYSLFSTNEAHFGEEDEDEYDPENKTANLEKYGWIRKEKDTGEILVCFNEIALKKHLTATLGPNRYESAVNKWKNERILNVRERKDKETDRVTIIRTVQIKVHNRNTTVLQIPLKNFYKYLNLSENQEPGNDPTDKKLDAKPEQPINKTPSKPAKVVNSILDLEKEAGITSHDEPPDNIILVDDDAEAAEILRQEGLL